VFEGHLTETPARSGLLIKVALLVTPTLLRGVVADALSSLPEALVEEPETLGAADGPSYDVIVMSLPEPDEYVEGCRMLARFPASRIVALRGDASRAFLYEMRPHCTALGELSPQTLRDAVLGRVDATESTE
jgi:hypothetical protein